MGNWTNALESPLPCGHELLSLQKHTHCPLGSTLSSCPWLGARSGVLPCLNPSVCSSLQYPSSAALDLQCTSFTPSRLIPWPDSPTFLSRAQGQSQYHSNHRLHQRQKARFKKQTEHLPLLYRPFRDGVSGRRQTWTYTGASWKQQPCKTFLIV